MTLKNVANRAGVAIDTVRKALRDDPTIRPYLKERVMRAAEELDYHPNLVARALRERALPVVPISVTELENPYFGSLARHLSRTLSDEGLEPALCLDAEHLMKLCRTLAPCGSILGYGYAIEHVKALSKRQKLVIIGAHLQPVPGVAAVEVDFGPAYKSVITTLARRGCHRIAIQSNTVRLYQTRASRASKIGAVAQAASAAGVVLVEQNGDDFFDRIEDVLGFIDAHPGEVDAVICENDQVAARLIATLWARGLRVPDDIAVVGCDANLVLTGALTVRIDTLQIARGAVSLLMRLLGGEKQPDPFIYVPDAVDSLGQPLA